VKDGRDVIVVSNEIAPNTFDHPTAEEINALPDKFRQYILDLETCCDKSGDGQTIAMLREDREALQRRVEELEDQVKLLTHFKGIERLSRPWCTGNATPQLRRGPSFAELARLAVVGVLRTLHMRAAIRR
jgi:plasmid stabilization system protein ParE